MNTAITVFAPSSARVFDLLQHRLQLSLRGRTRYRYVKPRVFLEDGCYRVQSPCCSRRIDPEGGLIDIALLEPQPDKRWRLASRDHVTQTWVTRCQQASLRTVLDLLCNDPDRQFWP